MSWRFCGRNVTFIRPARAGALTFRRPNRSQVGNGALRFQVWGYWNHRNSFRLDHIANINPRIIPGDEGHFRFANQSRFVTHPIGKISSNLRPNVGGVWELQFLIAPQALWAGRRCGPRCRDRGMNGFCNRIGQRSVPIPST